MRKGKNQAKFLLFWLEVPVLPRPLSFSCTPPSSTRSRCYLRGSTSPVLQLLITSKRQLTQKLKGNSLGPLFLLVERRWLSSLMICPCLLLTLGEIKLLLKSQGNWLIKKVSISSVKTTEELSSPLKVFSSWVLWITQVVVGMTFPTDLRGNSSLSIWLHPLKNQLRTFMVES